MNNDRTIRDLVATLRSRSDEGGWTGGSPPIYADELRRICDWIESTDQNVRFLLEQMAKYPAGGVSRR